MQAFMGGAYINQFNRFGRQWRVFLQAEADQRETPNDISGYYVRNGKGDMVPLSAFVDTKRVYGPEFTNRFNLFRAAQVIGTAAPGYSSGQAMAALEQVAKETLPSEIGYDWSGDPGKEKWLSPLPFKLIQNWPAVGVQLAAATVQGIQAFIGDLGGLTSTLPLTTQSPVTNTPVSTLAAAASCWHRSPPARSRSRSGAPNGSAARCR